jgi:hypothetical protein
MDQEVKDYIDTKIEGLYLSLTEIVGNAMAHQAFCNKVNSKFYKDYPEFKDKKEIVASVVEMMDGKDPGSEYDKILELAVPKIRERIAMTQGMNMTSVDPPKNRDFGNGAL